MTIILKDGVQRFIVLNRRIRMKVATTTIKNLQWMTPPVFPADNATNRSLLQLVTQNDFHCMTDTLALFPD
jgi:hypothetical protein